ncbi:MAG: hypothetical protein M1832_003451 [Thelocarpon impressellum]|nr:MAG: hypothetical protein M1832_003451 [Thelocarpon impressellum]
MPSSAPPSQPVGIPSRGGSGGARKDVRGGSGHGRRGHPDRHRPDTIQPAVAALLAVTAIPPMQRPAQRRRAEEQRRTEVLSLLKEESEKMEHHSLFRRSAMDVLMAPPDRLSADDDERSLPIVTGRSVSSDSVPSLDTDDESVVSSSSPLTPRMLARRASFERRGRTMPSALLIEDCALSHPLLSPLEPPAKELPKQTSGPARSQRPPAVRQSSSFKSNLTASLRALRSAALSISTLTSTPFVAPDDFLTRSIPYTDERRPLPLDHAPTPALRRYLNPTPSSTPTPPPTILSHIARPPRVTASIQLQTYPLKASNKAPRRQDMAIPATRPRELRENPDFLRVIVLEMAMRRRGKLAEAAAGRARFVLPARKVGEKREEEGGGDVGDCGVPRRWVGVCAGE